MARKAGHNTKTLNINKLRSTDMKRFIAYMTIAIAFAVTGQAVYAQNWQGAGAQSRQGDAAGQPAAGKRMAVTALSENMMRAQPDYESALETQSLMGTIVEIIGEDRYWRQVVTPEPYTAWCTNLGLVEMTAEEINEYKAAPKYICTAHHSAVYTKPSAASQRLSDLSMGNLLRVVFTQTKKGEKPSVAKEAGKGGAMEWNEVRLPDGRTGWTPAADLAEFEKWMEKPKPSEAGIISTAMQFVGTPYLWGGTSSKGLDCSGLVRLTWFMNGYLLPRNASQQVFLGREIIVDANHSIGADSPDLYDEMVKRTCNLKPGDLVFFGNPETRWKKESITHVGIYPRVSLTWRAVCSEDAPRCKASPFPTPSRRSTNMRLKAAPY